MADHPPVGGPGSSRFRLGASSMVYGEDLGENIERLARRLGHVEIVLFQTPDLHNLPGESMLAVLQQAGEENGLTYSIHLPASLEIAADDDLRRDRSISFAAECWHRLERISPTHCVLHIPYTPPTLVPVPGSYFREGEGGDWDRWWRHALASLERLEDELGWSDRLLVENINFSPSHLRPLLESGLCRLCLDLGHLLLGGEAVSHTLRTFRRWLQEVHLHGVAGYTDHLGLGVLPEPRLSNWLRTLAEIDFDGVLILEVFTPGEFEESLALVEKSVAV